MKKILVLVVLLIVAVLAALPLIRNQERGPLDDAARSAAPGRFATLAHGQVHYRELGPPDGEAVILVPGFSVPSYVFEPLDTRLAEAGFRVVTFDLYGRGWSDRPNVIYDRDLFAAQLGELMSVLKIDRAHLVGLSMGGAIVGRFAARQPDRVQRVVFIAPFTRARDIAPLQWPWIGEWMTRVTVLPRLAEGQTSDFVRPEDHPDWAERFLPQMRFDGFGRAILSTLRHVMTQDSLEDFATIGTQVRDVFVVWGRQDSVVPFVSSEAVIGAIPQAQLMAVDASGHLPHIEHADVVAARIVEFLRVGRADLPR